MDIITTDAIVIGATTVETTTVETTPFVPQTITLTDVVREGMYAWEKGTLAAAAGDTDCKYENEGLNCIVGAAMTDETIQILKDQRCNGLSVDLITERGLIVVQLPEDLTKMTRLQGLHDGGDLHDLHNRLTDYAELLGLPVPESFRALRPTE
jgi:hypothetical protein